MIQVKKFELKGELLKKITNNEYNVVAATLSDNELMYDFAKELYFDVKAPAKKSTRGRLLIKLLKSPGKMFYVPGVSRKSFSITRFLSSDPNELCIKLKLLLQEKQAGNNSDIINEEFVAIADRQLEYKCISTKKHKILLIKCLK